MKGLYIHIPFCIKKCAYCDFISFPDCDGKFDAYVDALINEMKCYKGTEIDTVFIGGGTPSVLPPYLISKLCEAVNENFVISDDVEWTMELNPGTVTPEKIQAMLCGGINRVSVGVQSFNDEELQAVGRIHNSREAISTVIELSSAGFTNISIDLMASLPYQTMESFKASLNTAVSLPITHISVYSLIIEDGTPIKEKYNNGEYEIPDEDDDRDLYKFTAEFLAQHGFSRYEISNYAKPFCESRHNLKYWNCDEYIGIGVAAHSYIAGMRSYNTDKLSEYLGGVTESGRDILEDSDKRGEFMMLGLRKIDGVDKQEFYKRFGCLPENIWGNTIDKFVKTGFIINSDNFCSLTEKGLDVANSIMCEFL